MLRVAAIQFVPAADGEQNLTTYLALIARAVREHDVKLVVLPEFASHPVIESDEARARALALDPDAPFLRALRAACVEHRLHLVVGVSQLREDRLTSSAHLYGPDGALLACVDRQIFDAEEPGVHRAGSEQARVVPTELGALGLCVGRDVASLETARALAIAGAQLICTPFAGESARDLTVHLAARASENRVFVVAAGAATNRAGEPCERSQIVGPDGQCVAAASDAGASLVVAELALERTSDKTCADGTDLFALRRPELYRPLGSKLLRLNPSGDTSPLRVAVLTSVEAGSVDAAVESAAGFVRELAQRGVQLLVLPELFCFDGGRVEDPEAASTLFQPTVRRLAEACADTALHVVTSLVEPVGEGYGHVGVVIGHGGVVARAGQLHVPPRHAWATPARRFEPLPLPWGKLGLLLGEDAVVPEAARALALLGAELLVAPLGAGDPALPRSVLSAAALENELPVLAAQRGAGLIVDPTARGDQRYQASDEPLVEGTVQRPTMRTRLLDRPLRVAQALLTPPVATPV